MWILSSKSDISTPVFAGLRRGIFRHLAHYVMSILSRGSEKTCEASSIMNSQVTNLSTSKAFLLLHRRRTIFSGEAMERWSAVWAGLMRAHVTCSEEIYLHSLTHWGESLQGGCAVLRGAGLGLPPGERGDAFDALPRSLTFCLRV